MKELKEFEKNLVSMVRNIRFRKRINPFLTKLKNEIVQIYDQKDLIVPADKTTNKYLVTPEKYMNMLDKEVQKSYKKETPENVKTVHDEHAKTANELDIGDRMCVTTPREAFILLKDHKEEFETNPKVRLINPCKPEVAE